MATRRQSDPPASPSRFRTERMVKDGGQWFFLTREGTVEGPFECRMSAANQLEVYIRLAVNDMLVEQSSYAMQV